MQGSPSDVGETREGIVAGLLAYVIWGLLPIYLKSVGEAAAIEVLLHRVVWALPFGAVIIFWRGQWSEVWRALTHGHMLLMLSTSAFFIAVNWYAYIIAIQREQVFQASLGYYINPLVYVLVGVFLLGEKLRRLQTAALLLAGVGVLVLTISGRQFPGIALFLAFSFTIYGVIRKRVVIGGMPGLFVEVLVLLPVALFWLSLILRSGDAAFLAGDYQLTLLLVLAGPVTVIPLLFFALAARRLPLSVIGFMQFIAPTLQFLTGIYYGERLTIPHLICFACIWVAVTLFSIDAFRSRSARVVTAAQRSG